MNSKRLLATVATILVLSAFDLPSSRGVWAQSNPAEVCQGDWDWSKNSLGQDPCQIASILGAHCRGFPFVIPPLSGAVDSYLPPYKQDVSLLYCECDSISYSLYMGCAGCQGGQIYSLVKWIARCDNVYLMLYPHDIPEGTTIPRWAFAYFDMRNADNERNLTFNALVAAAIGRDPEATPTGAEPGSSTSTSSKTAGSNSASSTSTSSTSTSNAVPGARTNTGTIAGGVAAGIGFLIISAVGAHYYLRWRKRRENRTLSPPPGSAEVSEHRGGQPVPSVTADTALPRDPYYSPGEPNTYPSPVTDADPISTVFTASSINYAITRPASSFRFGWGTPRLKKRHSVP